MSIQEPQDRQILACVGNRYVVFGSDASLPGRRQLGPEDVTVKLPRVADERNEAEDRIARSLLVDGFMVQMLRHEPSGNVSITDREGHRIVVEIKVGDRDFAGIALGEAWNNLASAADDGERRELWGFNTERLNLGIVWSEGHFGPRFEKLRALNVWEYGSDGSVFQRSDVVDEVDDWVRRLESVYAEVEEWALAEGMTVSRDRTVPLSEEIMQNFAVADRDMPVLDIEIGQQPIISMVPSGLWLIGWKGLIDLITQDGTFRLGALPQGAKPPKWVLVNGRTRTSMNWSRDAFRSILGLVPAGE